MNTFHARGITFFSELLSEDDPSGNRLEISLTELRTQIACDVYVITWTLYNSSCKKYLHVPLFSNKAFVIRFYIWTYICQKTNWLIPFFMKFSILLRKYTRYRIWNPVIKSNLLTNRWNVSPLFWFHWC